MIVFDLRCPAGHVFEAWFASGAAWEAQRAAGHVACPICGDTDIGKAVMAPAVAAKGNQRAVEAAPDAAKLKEAVAQLARMQAGLLEKSQWVGTAFAERARAMHSGEEAAATIHGQASVAEARELAAEGVPLLPLPLPVLPPDQVN